MMNELFVSENFHQTEVTRLCLIIILKSCVKLTMIEKVILKWNWVLHGIFSSILRLYNIFLLKCKINDLILQYLSNTKSSSPQFGIYGVVTLKKRITKFRQQHNHCNKTASLFHHGTSAANRDDRRSSDVKITMRI